MTDLHLTHTQPQDIEPGDILDLVEAARGLLLKVESITSADFSIGADREPRDRLRRVLERLGELSPDDCGDAYCAHNSYALNFGNRGFVHVCAWHQAQTHA